MTNISASEVKRVISALPNRRTIPNFGSRIRPHSSEFRAYQRKLVQQIKPILAKSIPFEKIDKIAAENEKNDGKFWRRKKRMLMRFSPIWIRSATQLTPDLKLSNWRNPPLLNHRLWLF
jgi:hypothetical protein